MNYLKKCKSNKIFLSLIAALFMILSYSVLFLDKRVVIHLGKEDGFFECLDFIYCLASGLIFLTIFFKIKTMQKRNNYFFLILGLIFLFGAGEEISWGQRMFGWATPVLLRENNMQSEITFHNLAILGRSTINRLFLLFSFFYCLFVPILDVFSNSFHKHVVKYDIPIASVYVGLFFPINYGLSKLLELYEKGPLNGLHYPLMEIKECNLLFLWFLISLVFLKERLKKEKQEALFN